jgi:hypothetical protein
VAARPEERVRIEFEIYLNGNLTQSHMYNAAVGVVPASKHAPATSVPLYTSGTPASAHPSVVRLPLLSRRHTFTRDLLGRVCPGIFAKRMGNLANGSRQWERAVRPVCQRRPQSAGRRRANGRVLLECQSLLVATSQKKKKNHQDLGVTTYASAV